MNLDISDLSATNPNFHPTTAGLQVNALGAAFANKSGKTKGDIGLAYK